MDGMIFNSFVVQHMEALSPALIGLIEMAIMCIPVFAVAALLRAAAEICKVVSGG